MLVGRLEDTRFYQDAKAEAREEERAKVIRNLLHRGLTLEAIAEVLELPVEEVTQIAQQQPT
jgi:predicted transposase YdaD